MAQRHNWLLTTPGAPTCQLCRTGVLTCSPPWRNIHSMSGGASVDGPGNLVELTIPYAVPDIAKFVRKVQLRQANDVLATVFEV